jgi:hypothetical protein
VLGRPFDGRPFDIVPVQAGTPILAIGCDRREKLQPRSQGPAIHVPAWKRTLHFGVFDYSSAHFSENVVEQEMPHARFSYTVTKGKPLLPVDLRGLPHVTWLRQKMPHHRDSAS